MRYLVCVLVYLLVLVTVLYILGSLYIGFTDITRTLCMLLFPLPSDFPDAFRVPYREAHL
jgi:hypothetical protein